MRQELYILTNRGFGSISGTCLVTASSAAYAEMICLSFHGVLFLGRATLKNSIPQKTVSVIAEVAILLAKYAVNRGKQKGGRG